ncbi:hypothetical protein [Metamycoplasma cloacale]|nr:hypothetical protein [Metamycoplasma cloacale]
MKNNILNDDIIATAMMFLNINKIDIIIHSIQIIELQKVINKNKY